MKGANEFAKLFKTGQYDRLYLVSGEHARGKTFRIYVLPEGEKAIPNGENNAPLNNEGVEVYGVVSGNLGWTENYGWLHDGKWQDDFYKLVRHRKTEIDQSVKKRAIEDSIAYDKELEKTAELLASY